MGFITAITTVLFVIVCIFLIVVILLQPGKGEGLGALGGMQTQFFGGGGATTFLAKVTTGLAIGYMALVILLTKLTQPTTQIHVPSPMATPAATSTSAPAESTSENAHTSPTESSQAPQTETSSSTESSPGAASSGGEGSNP